MKLLNTLLTSQKGKLSIASIITYLASDKASLVVGSLQEAPEAFTQGVTEGASIVQIISVLGAVWGFLRKNSERYKNAK